MENKLKPGLLESIIDFLKDQRFAVKVGEGISEEVKID